MAGTKGMQTRQRIVELAAPVFNRQGYVGASMRDLVDATGLEKGGIYNHFGSKEQLALEAYDYAMAQVTEGLARSQDGATDAIDRLQRMIRAFAKFARRPAIAGGCPIMNTAIEADDTHPELRDRARESMTLWHRLDRPHREGRQRRRHAASPASTRTRSPSLITGCARRRADALAPLRRPVLHRPHRRPPRPRTSTRCAPNRRTAPMTAIETHSRRRCADPHHHAGPTPRSRASAAAASTATNAWLRSSGASWRRRPPSALLGLELDERRAGPHGVLHARRRDAREPDGHDARRHRRDARRHRDGLRGRRRNSPADAGFTTLELKTNYVRAITQATGRIYAEGTVVHSGGRVATTEARVHDYNGTLYAHATSTCLILRGTR